MCSLSRGLEVAGVEDVGSGPSLVSNGTSFDRLVQSFLVLLYGFPMVVFGFV